MIAPDSFVFDLIFQRNGEFDQEQFMTAMGGEEVMEKRLLVDADQDPQFEMQVSPSMPFRQRGEKRLLVFDGSLSPIEATEEGLVKADLRSFKDELERMFTRLPLRLARIFCMASPGTAVIMAENMQEMRAWCLGSWVLHPQIDVDGRERSTPLGRPDFEAKMEAYPKRLEELTEKQVLERLRSGTYEDKGNGICVSCLDSDGFWDVIKSIHVEGELAAVETFATIPGAPYSGSSAGESSGDKQADTKEQVVPEPVNETPATETPVDKAFSVHEWNGSWVAVFEVETFDPQTAALFAKRDYTTLLQRAHVEKSQQNQVEEHGMEFVAPIEFLSEVFVEGVPLGKPYFEEHATQQENTKRLDVHCPRFGAATLVEMADGKRFVSSFAPDTLGLVDFIKSC